MWALAGGLILAATLASFAVLELSGCLSPRLDVTVTVRNLGSRPLGGLSLDQEDGPGHALVPVVAPGSTVSVLLTSDDPFGESAIHLVDDVSGRDYALPPFYFENALRGTIDVEVERSAPGAGITGRARCSTSYPGGVQAWGGL
jgi:hypothetical protein